MEKFAALKFNAYNIGDEIQSIAAQRFLPQVDYYVFREQLHRFHSENDEKVKLIMNSWYMWKPKNWPPSECIDPLLISMYFYPGCRDTVLSKKGIEFFQQHGPVGCRDLHTKKWLEDNGIPAYFSSCLTSTLIANEKIREENPCDYILCVDCPDPIEPYIRQHTDRPVYSFNKQFSPYIESLDRMELAKAVLFMFQNAHCVITTNLHTAIPCLAFHTSVCYIEKESYLDWGIGRFEGLEGFFNQQTEESFLNGGYDFNSPPENPRAFEQYRDLLVERCKGFTGFDANRPTIEDDFEPLHTVLAMISARDFKYNNIKRVLYYAGKRDLLKMLVMKAVRNTDRNDIYGEDYLKLKDTFRR